MQELTIISGGQTGPDRAALDFAVEQGIAYAGWCPQGGWAEDMPEPPGLLDAYPRLRPTASSSTRTRTVWNVRESDAVIIFTAREADSPGTDQAEEEVLKSGAALLKLTLPDPEAGQQIKRFLSSLEEPIRLGVGGPRESEAPGLYKLTFDALKEALARD